MILTCIRYELDDAADKKPVQNRTDQLVCLHDSPMVFKEDLRVFEAMIKSDNKNFSRQNRLLLYIYQLKALPKII
jgi:hypothetical protein